MNLASVLDAAERLLGERPWFRVTLEEVAAAAGADPAEVRGEFGSTERLLVRTVQQRAHELRAHLHRAVAGLTSRAVMEGVGFNAFFEWLHEHPNVYRLLRQVEMVDEEAFRHWYRDLAADYARGLARAMDDGEIPRADPESLAFCLMGMGEALGMRYLTWEGRRELPQDVSRTFTRVMSRVLAPSPAGPQR